MMLKLSVLLCLLGAVAGYMVMLGTHSYPTDSPIVGTYPAFPRVCHVTYFLMTHSNQEMCTYDEELTDFNPEKKTYIIVHGMRHSAEQPWMEKMCQAILDNEPANCFMMDWRSCSWDIYIQLLQHIIQLGSSLHKFMYFLQQHGCKPQNICLIGANVGAYIAGEAGKLTKGLDSIVALDPAGPMFEGQGHHFLNRNCAAFVQVLHTSTDKYQELGLGIQQPLGHMDCYINGGRKMPECPPLTMSPKEAFCLLQPLMGPIECPAWDLAEPDNCIDIMGDREFTLDDIVAQDYKIYCSHHQSINYFIKSITNQKEYMGEECATVEDCLNGVTMPCPNNQCRPVGFFARPLGQQTANSTLYCLNATALPVLTNDPDDH